MNLSHKITVAAPKAKVWDFLMDIPRVAESSPALMRQIESKWSNLFAQRPSPPPGVGGVERVADTLGIASTTVTDDSLASGGAEMPRDMGAGEAKNH